MLYVWFNAMDIWSVQWLLMPWCFSTRTSLATVLSTHPCVSSCYGLRGLQRFSFYQKMILINITLASRFVSNVILISIFCIKEYFKHKWVRYHRRWPKTGTSRSVFECQRLNICQNFKRPGILQTKHLLHSPLSTWYNGSLSKLVCNAGMM